MRENEQEKTWWLLEWIRTYFGGQRSLNLNSKEVKDSNSMVDILDHAYNSSWKMRTIRVRNTTIQTLPESIGFFANLVTLDLSHNYLDELPWAMVYLRQLNHLDISYNEFITVPHMIEYLTSLRVLCLDYNKLRVLPRCVLKLVNLKRISVAGNPLICPTMTVCSQGIQAIFQTLRCQTNRQNLWKKGSGDSYTRPLPLQELCVNCVLDNEVKFLLVKRTPPRLKNEILAHKKLRDSLINVMKCSDCHRFFSNRHYFDTHNCN